MIVPPPLPLAALIAAISPAAPLEHGTNAGGAAEAVVAGATVKTSSAALVPIAIFKSEVNLMGYPLVVNPRMHPLVFYPRAETALVTPACILSDTGRPRLRIARGIGATPSEAIEDV